MADSKLAGQPEDVKADVRGLRDRVGRSRLRGKILAYSAAAVAALILISWAGYYASSTDYASAKWDEIKLYRDDADPDRLAIDYTPNSTGVVGVSHIPKSTDGTSANGDHTTELLPRAYLGNEGERRRFHWRVDDLKTGDIVKVTYKKGWSLGTKEFLVPEFVPSGDLPAVEEMPGTSPSTVPMDGAALSGRIVSALDGAPISGAEVRIGGTALREQTDTKGNFRIVGIPEGSQKIEVAAAGYAPRDFERELTDGMESGYQVALKPKAEGGNIRIALDWDREDDDLDAHLEGPLPKGGKFHIDRHHPGTDETKGVVALTTDEEAEGGSETIEVTKVVPGTYRYFVHDFSSRHDPNGKALARSGAEVTVSYGGESYRFRPKRKGKGNLWDVCTIEVTDDGGIVNRIDAFQGIKPELLGLYDRRTQGDRGTWITNYGGSVASEKAVTDGLDWLARHQGPDGFWSAKTMEDGEWSQCKGKRCEGAGHSYPMGQTGLALLAFQAGGHYYFNNRQYSDKVRTGLDWMVEHQTSDGALVSEKQSRGGHSKGYHKYYMYDHGIATFALADACAAAKALGQTPDPKYAGALGRAVRFIYSQQHDDGGWRYTDKFERHSDTSVTGWQVLALKSAREAGLKLEYSCIEKIRDFFDKSLMGDHGRTWYESSTSPPVLQSDATTGIGMLVRQFLLDEPDHPSIPKAANYLANLAERHKADRTVEKGKANPDSDYALEYNYYLWYNCTLGMFQAGGDAWDRWNPIIRNIIIGLQRHKGCERGSWDPDTKWGMSGGRIYTTALACLTLETYYRYTRQKERTGGEAELYVVSPGVIPAVVRAEPEPIEFHIRGDDVIKQIAAPKPVFVPRPVVRTPVVVPPATVIQRPVVPPATVIQRPVVPPAAVVQRPVVPATPPVVPRPPLPKRSVKVGGAKIITVGAAKYGDIQIEAEIEEKPTTFQLTLTTIRPGAAGVPLQPHEFGFRLVDATGRKVPLQTPPTAGPVRESGNQTLRGKMVAQLGPRGTITITDLHKLTLRYKEHALQHSLQTQYR